MYRVLILPVLISIFLPWSSAGQTSRAQRPASGTAGQGNTPLLQHEDQPARKPEVMSTWVYAGKLIASDGRQNDELGYSVAISGNTIVVGAPYATVNSRYAQGAAYVFVKSPNGWVRRAKLTASDGAGNAFFGSAVSISGDTVVVGANGVNIKTDLHAGAAYVFVKPPSGWATMTQTAKLTAADEAAKAYLGSSIAIGGNTVAVGADGAAVGSSEFQGAVYVFTKPAKGWATTSKFAAKLTASDGARGDQLGYSVSMHGNTIVAGARSASVGSNVRQGAAYVFVGAENGWSSEKEAAKLTASDGAKDDHLGYSVATDGDTVVVGAPAASSPGTAYLFVKPGGGWSSTAAFTAKLTASDGTKGDQLGYSVSVNGDTVVGGARSAKVDANARQGAMYVFTKLKDGWTHQTQSFKLTAPGGGAEDGLGSAVGITGHTIVAGAVDARVGSKKYQGAAYVFSAGPPHKAGKTVAVSKQK